MQLFVRTLRGGTIAVDAQPTDTVSTLKAQVSDREFVEPQHQRLLYAGKQLEDGRTLADYGVQKLATIDLVLRLSGGAKKRKKKNYTTPKKIKHKRKKVKMSILKYFTIDKSGHVKRLRRECPNETCGAGVYMAQMADRQYCGKCHLTYKFQAAK